MRFLISCLKVFFITRLLTIEIVINNENFHRLTILIYDTLVNTHILNNIISVNKVFIKFSKESG